MNINLLKDLNFAEKLNATEAITESGKECLKNYRGYLYTNPATCGLVNGFIQEARQFSFDAGMMSILESVLKYVNENNISWKLASACEGINNNNAQYNYIAKLGVGQVEKLLEMKESEIVQYIKAGALKNLQYIPEFRAICKEVYRSTVNEVHTVNYSLTNPVSFVKVDESGVWFNIAGYTYNVNEGKVTACNSDDAQFNRINSLLPNFQKTNEGLKYSYKVGYGADPYQFSITESEITFTKGKFSEAFNNAIDFRQFADTFSKTLLMNEKMAFLQTANSIAEVFEAMDKIAEVDNAKILESANGTVLVIVEADDNVNMTIVKSPNCGASINNYEYMVEALREIEKISGVNLNSVYENRINEDCKKQDPESYKQIQEQLAATKDAQMDIRRKKIEQLAEAYKNDPVRIALLSNISKELQLLS